MPSIFAALQDGVTKLAFGKEVGTEKKAFYDLVDRDMDGNDVNMEAFRGDVLCVVNVASKWGLTKANYVQFSKLFDEYGARGFKILAFPCNQFGGQEPGTHKEILEFVDTNFGAGTAEKFTWFEKGHVNGKDTREVYSFLKQELPAEDGTADIRWNFGKFLVDRAGVPVQRFGPKTGPKEMAGAIEALLAAKRPDNKN